MPRLVLRVSGAGLPQRGEVTELLAEDASQVQFGQVLFRIKPIV